MRKLRSFGFSVIELMLAAALVGILTTLVFGAYAAGLKSLFKSHSQNDLLSELQVLARRVSNELQQSTQQSVTISGDGRATSFLTSYDIDGQPQFTSFATQLWTAYLVIHLDTATKSVLLRRVELNGSSPQRTLPTTIDRFNPGGGAKPINFYRAGGRRIAQYVESLNIEVVPTLVGGYRFTVDAIRPAVGNRAESRSTMVFTVVVRN